MAHTFYRQYAIMRSLKKRGRFAVPQIDLYDGVTATYDTPNGPGAILRFGATPTDFGDITALTNGDAGTWDSTYGEQFLTYKVDAELFKARTWEHIYSDFSKPYEGLKNDVYMVDLRETGSLANAATVTNAYKYYQDMPDDVTLRQLSSPGDSFYHQTKGNNVFMEPIVGKIASQEKKLFIPDTLFGSGATVDISGSASGSLDTFTKDDASAAAVIDVSDAGVTGTPDLEALYETASGDSTHMILIVDTANNTAVWGYIRGVSKSTHVYTLSIFDDAAGTNQNWNGAAGDKNGTFATYATEWYIIAVNEVYTGEYAFLSDDATDISGNLIAMDNHTLGILALTTAQGSAGDTVSYYYSEYERQPVPSNTGFAPWEADQELCVLRTPSIAMIADANQLPTVGGYINRR